MRRRLPEMPLTGAGIAVVAVTVYVMFITHGKPTTFYVAACGLMQRCIDDVISNTAKSSGYSLKSDECWKTDATGYFCKAKLSDGLLESCYHITFKVTDAGIPVMGDVSDASC